MPDASCLSALELVIPASLPQNKRPAGHPFEQIAEQLQHLELPVTSIALFGDCHDRRMTNAAAGYK